MIYIEKANECGCKILFRKGLWANKYWIEYCPTHKVAPELLATHKAILLGIGNVDHSQGHGPNAARMRGEMLVSIRELARQAINKVEGR